MPRSQPRAPKLNPLQPTVPKSYPIPRKANGTFQKGFSGNQGGRAPGSRARVSREIFSRLEGETAEILEVLLKNAKAGNSHDARFLLSLFIPKAKNASVDVGQELPPLDDARGIAEAHSAVITAAATGRLDSDSAAALSMLLTHQKQMLETVVLAEKLNRLEQREVLDVEALEEAAPILIAEDEDDG